MTLIYQIHRSLKNYFENSETKVFQGLDIPKIDKLSIPLV